MSSARTTFISYLGHHRLRLAGGVGAIAMGAFLSTIPPRFIGQIIDELREGTTVSAIGRLALLMLAFAAGYALFHGAGRYLCIDAARRVEYEMRNDLFLHLQRMHLGYFQAQRIGDLMARVTNDLNAVRMMLGPGFLSTTYTGTTFAFTVAAMLGLSVQLTLIAATLLPMVTLTFAIVGRQVHRRFERVQARFGDMSAKAQENFSGIRVVKAFVQEEAEIRSFAHVNAEYVARSMELARMQAMIWPVMSFIIGFAVLSALYVGGQQVIRGELTVGQLVQFVAYLALLAHPMIALGWVSNLVQQGWASMVRLQDIFAAVPAIASPAQPVTSPIRGDVEFRAVSFAYGDRPVLRGIDLHVPAGGSLGIVGHTGGGKSTLVNLIPRMFDPLHGSVRIDGHDVRSYALEDLRRAVGYVPQETFLFSTQLRENIGFGLVRRLNDAELAEIGDLAQLDSDIQSFPARYDTVIGERGVTLSGGQKQRVAIARALAKDAPILILDDALSAVDTYTEAEILRRLRVAMRGRTSIVVAHRISTVKDMDQIVVLDEGRIAERGAHQELLEQDGLYARMYRRQLIEQELGVDAEEDEHRRRVAEEGLH